MDVTNNSGIKTLEELASEDCCILFDTSVITPLGKGKEFFDSKTIKEKADFKEQNSNFLHELVRHIANKGNFFVTGCVLEEIGNRRNYDYKKTIRREGACKDRELLRLRRLIKRGEQEQRRVLNAFIDNDKVVILEGEMKKLYDRISEKYQMFIGKYSLSHADFDFLLTGITLAMASIPIIFVSNDYKIFYARDDILEDENIKEKDVSFLTRVDFFKFRPLFYHKHPKIEQLLGGS